MSTPKVMTYAAAHKWEAEARRLGVSKVARSSRGFMRAYQRAGSWARLPESWKRKRNAFVARHMAQSRQSGERLWKRDARDRVRPSRRALALIMWAYMPPGRSTRVNPPTPIITDDQWVDQWMGKLIPEVDLSDESTIRELWPYKGYQIAIVDPAGDGMLIWIITNKRTPVGAGGVLHLPDGLYFDVAAIKPAHQRKGLYREILRKFKSLYPGTPMFSGSAQTEGSSSVWRSLGAIEDPNDPQYLRMNPRDPLRNRFHARRRGPVRGGGLRKETEDEARSRLKKLAAFQKSDGSPDEKKIDEAIETMRYYGRFDQSNPRAKLPPQWTSKERRKASKAPRTGRGEVIDPGKLTAKGADFFRLVSDQRREAKAANAAFMRRHRPVLEAMRDQIYADTGHWWDDLEELYRWIEANEAKILRRKIKVVK